MKQIKIIVTIILISSAALLNAQKGIDTGSAKIYLNQFEQLLKADSGMLWGQKLPHKLLFVNPKDYTFVANEPLEIYSTKEIQEVYIGQYPKEKGIANTSVVIDSIPWTMVMWPPSKTMDIALELMAHEAYHSLQHLLGIQINVMAIPHMDEKDARVLFRLEVNALYEALFGKNKKALNHAIFFRSKRFELYPKSKDKEILLETHEGLAQYTGYKLAYTDKERLKNQLKQNIKSMAKKSSLIRATAYTSGPLYGLILDASGEKWRKQALHNFQARQLSMKHHNINEQMLEDLNFDEIKTLYNFKEIEAEETKRQEKRRKKVQMYNQKLIEDSPLIIELIDKQIGFNPNSIIPLGDHGNVYEYFILKDKFGVLTAKKGALMSHDQESVSVSKPVSIDENKAEGDGWGIELKEGYQITKKGQSYSIRHTKNRLNSRPE